MLEKKNCTAKKIVKKEQQNVGFMYLKRINSRFVDAIGYDPQASLLEIKFKISGRIYAFLEVQKDIYRSFINSRSKGHFFNQHIKDNYKYIKIK